MRAALTCALAAAVVLPTACASAGSTPDRTPSSAAFSSERVLPTTAPRTRKPITVKVGTRFFGVHDSTLQSLSEPAVGSIRLWADGVTWRELEPTPGVYNFTKLDAIVAAAHAAGKEVTLAFGNTPYWAGANGNTSALRNTPPDIDYYRDFVTTVMERYKSFNGYRGIANYQVWNEPNIKTYFDGTLPQVAQMVYTAWQVRQSVDPGAKLIAPSLVTRLSYEMKAIGKFYKLKVGGKPVWRYVDAAAFSMYPVDFINGRAAGPEDMMTLLKGVRSQLALAHVPSRLPLWNAEINYGYGTGSRASEPAVPISDARQAGYVMRTYLLSAAGGFQRVFWYRYDTTSTGANTYLTEASAAPGTLTPAGQAFFRVRSWLKGTLVGTSTSRPCSKNRVGTYTCLIKYGRRSYGRVYWNPNRTVKVTTVRSAKSAATGSAAAKSLRGGSKIRVNYLPTLVRSRS